MLKPALLAALLAFSLAAHAADDSPPAPPDLNQIEQLQRRIDRLAGDATGENSYTLAQARAWLDEALIAYHNNDHSGSVEDAIARAVSLLSVFDANPDSIGLDTRNPYASEKNSADLWAIGYAVKQGGGTPCAELDAQLVWSGREKLESGWGNAEPYARIAESLAYAAQAAERCASAAKAPAPIATVAKEPVPVALAAPIAIEQISNTLTKATPVALFTYDSYRMVRGSRRGLDKIVAELKSWSSLERIQIIGHTDRLGKDANNKKLAQRRAEHVKTYLVSRGIPAAAIETKGLGATQPLVECTTQRNRRALINCLQPNRRVEMTIQGVWR